MRKYIQSHFVYVLRIDGDSYYVGSHNGSRTYTKKAILNQSACPLRMAAARKEISWEDLYSRCELLAILPCKSEQEAVNLEQELIDAGKRSLGDKMMNKQPANVMGLGQYKHLHKPAQTANRREKTA